MCCPCCKTRLYWFSKYKLSEYGCKALRELATQVEEMYLDGIDIQSQKTNEQLDEEDEGEEAQDLDAPMINWDVDFEIQNTSKI